MQNRLKLIYYFLRFLITKKNTSKSYAHMRNSYMVHHLWRIFDIICKINSLIRKKYKINISNGVLGELNNESVKKITDKIHQEGYYIFDQVLNEKLIDDICKFASNTPLHYSELQEDGTVDESKIKKSYIENKNLSNRHQIVDTSDMFNLEILSNLYFDENFLHISNNYFNARPWVDIFTLWWSNPVSNLPPKFQFNFKNYSAQMFHYDFDRMKMLKFFIYLTDVDDKNGPHVFVKGSHKKPAFFLTKDGRYDDNLIYSKYGDDVVHLKGKKGTILAVDTRGIHKGMELIEGERLVFQIEFTNSLFGKMSSEDYKNKVNLNIKNKFKETYSLFVNFSNGK